MQVVLMCSSCLYTAAYMSAQKVTKNPISSYSLLIA